MSVKKSSTSDRVLRNVERSNSWALLISSSQHAAPRRTPMCGRFTLRTNPSDLVEVFALLREPELTPRFNIAPTSRVAVVRQTGRDRELFQMRWGLVPSWSKDPKAGPPLINARGETIATKPAFRSAFKKRRCLIPADEFYDWKKLDAKTK